MVEHRTLNPLVEGSSPSALTSFGHRVASAPLRRFRAAMSFSVPPPSAFGATAGSKSFCPHFVRSPRRFRAAASLSRRHVLFRPAAQRLRRHGGYVLWLSFFPNGKNDMPEKPFFPIGNDQKLMRFFLPIGTETSDSYIIFPIGKSDGRSDENRPSTS